jgi:hypothetical protein
MYQGPSPFAMRPAGERVPVLTPDSATDISCRTVADPFLLFRNGVWYMFFEAWNAETGRGEIAYATSSTGLEWTYGGVVLREPFHLSYPHIFEHKGTVYMIPETRQAASVRLYAAKAFPEGWELVSTLLHGPYADSTVFFRDGKWWMFTQRGLDEMRIYSSSVLETGWTEHPKNPVWPGNRVYSRPGGRVLQYGGDWYRFAQDGVLAYGNNLRVLKINVLSDSDFEENETEHSPLFRASLKGWNALGMHHLDAAEIRPGVWIGAVDGATAGL